MQRKAFFDALDELIRQRGLDKEKVMAIIEHGLLNAYKKEYDNRDNVRVVFDEEKHTIGVYADYEVVEGEPEHKHQMSFEEAKKHKKRIKPGDDITINVTPSDFGRNAAMSAKQILKQGLKQLEREKVYDIFKDRENEMVNAEIIAMNREKDFVTLDLGHDLITSLPRKELLQSDTVRVGAKIKVYITKVEMTPKGPKIYVSRTDRNLVKRLVEQNVPEIMDGTVEIMGLARDAGRRSKIAVYSHDENVDPVGACLGRESKRKKEVEEALQGEKISFYRWSEDTKELIENALAPAKVVAINPDKREKTAVVIVKDEDFTGAIGSKGQNVRLAAQSSGWKIDIKSVADAEEMGINYTPLHEEREADEEEA